MFSSFKRLTLYSKHGCQLYRQPYLAPDFEFHYFTNYAKFINYVFCKILIRSSSFQKKILGGEKLKALILLEFERDV